MALRPWVIDGFEGEAGGGVVGVERCEVDPLMSARVSDDEHKQRAREIQGYLAHKKTPTP